MSAPVPAPRGAIPPADAAPAPSAALPAPSAALPPDTKYYEQLNKVQANSDSSIFSGWFILISISRKHRKKTCQTMSTFSGIIGLSANSSHPSDTILFFTDKGKCYWHKVHQIPQASRTSQGRAIVNLINCEPGEKVQAFVSVKEFNDTDYIVMATKNGIIKRSALS